MGRDALEAAVTEIAGRGPSDAPETARRLSMVYRDADGRLLGELAVEPF